MTDTQHNINLLLQLSIAPESCDRAVHCVAEMDAEKREQLLQLAEQHHVNVRVLRVLAQSHVAKGQELKTWADARLAVEHGAALKALSMLHAICGSLERSGFPVTVIKSLDHLPDLGSDFDLYTPAEQNSVVRFLIRNFNAEIEPRSWGDRLARKWSFRIPRLSHSIELHIGRLGQTGEHIALAQRFTRRRVKRSVEGLEFFVPAAEEQIIAATLQRMYRHFFFRICDIVNAAEVLRSGTLDFFELRGTAQQAGIWSGVATYLTVVSDMFAKFGGKTACVLPAFISASARFRAQRLYLSTHGFLRFPILPDAARLYMRQLTKAAAAGNIAATVRLSLLPPLASVAGLATKLVGSDKGIW